MSPTAGDLELSSDVDADGVRSVPEVRTKVLLIIRRRRFGGGGTVKVLVTGLARAGHGRL